MKKLGKILATLVVVVLVVALVVPMLFKGKIGEIVKAEANKMLEARLDFEDLDIGLLRHFPNASLDLEGLKLMGVGQFEGDTIVAADQISVVVNLMSLFGDSGFEVKKIILDTPQVHARKLANGAVNWDVMKPSEEPQEDESQEVDEESGTAFKLSVKDFSINDAHIRFEDDSSRMYFSTNPLSLNLEGDLSAEKSKLELALELGDVHFRSAGVPLLSGVELKLDADVMADLVAQRFEFEKNKLRMNAIEMNLDGWVDLDDDAMKMDVKAGCDEVNFKDVMSLIPAFYTKDFKNLEAKGELSLALWAKGEMRGRQLPAFELTTQVTNGYFRYSSLPKSVSNINLDLKVKNPGDVMDRTEVNLSKFGFTVDENKVNARFYATNLASDPSIKTAVEGRLDLGVVKDFYPLDEGMSLDGRIAMDFDFEGAMSAVEHQRYNQLKAKGQFVLEEINATLPSLPEVMIHRAAASITPQEMTLGNFNAEVGRSDVEANGQLTNYLGYVMKDETLGGRLYVKSNHLDLNEFMTSSDQETVAEEVAQAQEAETATPLSVIEVPKNMNLSLSTHLQHIEMLKMKIDNMNGEMKVKDGVLSLNNLQLDVFGGHAKASGAYSTANVERPTLNLEANFKDASFSKTFEELDMIQKMVPLFAKTGGDYSMSMNLSTELDGEMSPVLKSLNASGEIKSQNIKVQNLEVFDKMAVLLKNDNLRNIEARDVAIRFAVKDGRITTQPFDLKLAGMNVNLSGSTGLDQTIDYVARVAVSGVGPVKAIPVKIVGTFTNPKLTLGVKEAAEDALKEQLGGKLDEVTGGKLSAMKSQKSAEEILAKAEESGAKLVQAAEAQRQKLIDGAASKSKLAQIAAQKAGDKLVEEAEKQAAKLRADAEAKVAEMNK